MSSGQTSHSLAFRVMRLCRPSFHVDNPLRLDPADLLAGEDIFDDPLAASDLPRLLHNHTLKSNDSDLTYRTRFLLNDPSDAMGLSGLLVLPQSFGSLSLTICLVYVYAMCYLCIWLWCDLFCRAIYLGETFCSYISINNSSNFEVRDVVIKVSEYFVQILVFCPHDLNSLFWM